jgi:hypothetical protein
MPLRTLGRLETVPDRVLEYHHGLRTAVKRDEDQIISIKSTS